MGNVMAHILVKYAKDTGLESQAGPIDIALLNGGGVRASMSQGDVTVEDAYTVFPFSNTASVVAISGQKLLDALEHGVARDLRGRDGLGRRRRGRGVCARPRALARRGAEQDEACRS